MTQKQKPKVIILESNDAVREHAASILSKEGWDVTCEQVSKDALHTLAQSKKLLFTLFISNFKLPKMEGDDILQKVKALSPLTQRMLIIPVGEPDTLISAINKAKINSCITSPFNDEDLIYQAQHCFKKFKYALKRQRLKRITVHQNKQMYKIARKLRKKDTSGKYLVIEKNAQELKLKSKKRSAENKNTLNTNISLLSLMEHKEIEATPDAYKNEFLLICKNILDLFDQVTAKNNSDPVKLDLRKILDTKESDAPRKDQPKDESAFSGLIEKILKSSFTRTKSKETQSVSNSPEDGDDKTDTGATTPKDYFKISISENQATATIKKIKEFDSNKPMPDLSDLHDMLEQEQISYGLLEDEAIETWISKSCVNQIVIATGEEKVSGHDGKVKFHFKTPYTNPGKITEDGSINFRERGDIPYVRKNDLLAVKTPAQAGKPGISVLGVPIPVEEVIDPVFVNGPGTELSEDGLSIHAAIEGRPHHDALGSITVSPELVIPGNVDFETGNIDFKGNIIVKGMIKEGFSVKGINLTVQEIEGGIIDLKGDLNISAGITDSTISAYGNIYAKFINNSNITGFGNLSVSKEIIDSNIMLSGNCRNPAGHIIASRVTAKLGVEAGKIGTSSSKPVKLRVGVDDHIETLKKQVTEALEASVSKSNLLKDEIKRLEDQDQELYQQISDKTHIQDRVHVEIKELKKLLPELKKSNDIIKLQQASSEIKNLNHATETAEKELNNIFKTQDIIAKKTKQLKDQINLLEEKNKTYVNEKKVLKTFSIKEKPLPVITVAKTITQDSVIKGPHTSLTLNKDISRCKIQELTVEEDGRRFHDMNISDI